MITQLDRDLRASAELRRWYTPTAEETETTPVEHYSITSTGYMLRVSEKDDT